MTKITDSNGTEIKPCSRRGIELKPCPHCGSDSAVIFNPEDNYFCVVCQECAALSPGLTKKQAIESWNRRWQND